MALMVLVAVPGSSGCKAAF